MAMRPARDQTGGCTDLTPFCTCGLYRTEPSDRLDGFVVRQPQLSARTDATTDRLILRPALVDYVCRFAPKPGGHDPRRPLILIPSHEAPDLLARTVGNLRAHGAMDLCDVLLIDDRSTADYGPVVRDGGALSYLRIDTDGGFNFSMLCNIGGFLARRLGHDTIILWNNDVWIERADHLASFLDRHRLDRATLSGAKLLYPPDPPPVIAGPRGGSVQFGGFAWIRDRVHPGVRTPVHAHRGVDRDDPQVACDRPATCLTAALLAIDLAWFSGAGGLNPSLAVNFQDVDLCLRARLERRPVMYYGSNLFFWHAESASLAAAKRTGDPQLRSDRALFQFLWRDRLPALVD